MKIYLLVYHEVGENPIVVEAFFNLAKAEARVVEKEKTLTKNGNRPSYRKWYEVETVETEDEQEGS